MPGHLTESLPGLPSDQGDVAPAAEGVVAGPSGRARFRLGPAAMLDRRAVAGLAVLALLAVAYGAQHFWLARPQPVEVPVVAAAAAEPGSGGPPPSDAVPGAPRSADSHAEAAGAVVVDIGGRVHAPGLHTLPGGSRVADALHAAGGPLPGTETRNLNLARLLTDGEQILVGESGGAPPAGGPGTGGPAAGTPKQPVSLNHATLEQLDTLPGVGPTLAQRIIAFRMSHGSFRSVDQLRQVNGIGERTYAEIRPLLTL
ncbi:ComEA family DNA-binding protein [Kitasatospora sp. CM 4170]|uniref:ComEA family DNA-binding protein n=1 Tax=Kitasatospora aburaviensis TaxID=67265 RepID=A0ABW1ES66_9ACTN|nr:ComEA family DNA-binding protein [Kitasatospora sp. CM 4170]WNM45740.1 ComEA family DNA-binding protein [Kitasatospora sp. CM 4170]